MTPETFIEWGGAVLGFIVIGGFVACWLKWGYDIFFGGK